jgi:hypothetical protein
MAQFHSGKRIPSSLPVGDVFFDASKRDFYIAIADGRLVPLASLLAGPPIHGIDGAKGDKGDTGAQGIGAQGPQGLQGPKGEPGDILYLGPAEMQAAVKRLRLAMLEQRAQFQAAIDQARVDSGSLSESRRRTAEAILDSLVKKAGL